MIIIPAIDLKDGKCVRLQQGLMEKSTIFSDSPLEIAKKWIDLGASRIHLVDLNGAFAGKPIHFKTILEISKKFPNIKIQIGGGIRNINTASQYVESGVSYLIIGTLAVTNPDFVQQLCRKFPGKIIIGLDANNGFVATDGWAIKTNIKILDLAKKFEQYGVSAIIYTDITRDGMMTGVNVKATAKLANNTTIPIIASGGITNIDDIYALKNNNPNIIGAITGRAIYEGTLDFAEAVKIC